MISTTLMAVRMRRSLGGSALTGSALTGSALAGGSLGGSALAGGSFAAGSAQGGCARLGGGHAIDLTGRAVDLTGAVTQARPTGTHAGVDRATAKRGANLPAVPTAFGERAAAFWAGVYALRPFHLWGSDPDPLQA